MKKIPSTGVTICRLSDAEMSSIQNELTTTLAYALSQKKISRSSVASLLTNTIGDGVDRTRFVVEAFHGKFRLNRNRLYNDHYRVLAEILGIEDVSGFELNIKKLLGLPVVAETYEPDEMNEIRVELADLRATVNRLVAASAGPNTAPVEDVRKVFLRIRNDKRFSKLSGKARLMVLAIISKSAENPDTQHENLMKILDSI